MHTVRNRSGSLGTQRLESYGEPKIVAPSLPWNAGLAALSVAVEALEQRAYELLPTCATEATMPTLLALLTGELSWDDDVLYRPLSDDVKALWKALLPGEQLDRDITTTLPEPERLSTTERVKARRDGTVHGSRRRMFVVGDIVDLPSSCRGNTYDLRAVADRLMRDSGQSCEMLGTEDVMPAEVVHWQPECIDVTTESGAVHRYVLMPYDPLATGVVAGVATDRDGNMRHAPYRPSSVRHGRQSVAIRALDAWPMIHRPATFSSTYVAQQLRTTYNGRTIVGHGPWSAPDVKRSAAASTTKSKRIPRVAEIATLEALPTLAEDRSIAIADRGGSVRIDAPGVKVRISLKPGDAFRMRLTIGTTTTTHKLRAPRFVGAVIRNRVR